MDETKDTSFKKETPKESSNSDFSSFVNQLRKKYTKYLNKTPDLN